MSRPASQTYRVTKLAAGHDPGAVDLGAFTCGEPTYDDWLIRHAAASVQAGVAAVYLLLENAGQGERVVGYYAINPSQVIRDDVP